MLADRIEGDVAEPGAAVRRALIGDIGEQAHPAGAIDPPDAAGAAARTELARHPFGIGAAGLRAPRPALRGGDDVEAEHRGGGRIDVGSAASGAAAVVEGDAEHLADLFGLHRKSARRIDQPRVVRSIHPGEIEDDERGAFRVDGEAVFRLAAGGRGHGGDAGESGHHRVAQLQDRLCGGRRILRRRRSAERNCDDTGEESGPARPCGRRAQHHPRGQGLRPSADITGIVQGDPSPRGIADGDGARDVRLAKGNAGPQLKTSRAFHSHGA